MRKQNELSRTCEASHNSPILGFLCASSRSCPKIGATKLRPTQRNPRHPSLHFKKVGKLWSVRAGPHHRALAVEDGVDFIWVWIGPHDEYERIIKLQG